MNAVPAVLNQQIPGLLYVKPFLTNKGNFKDPTIILSVDNIIISDQTSVSNVLNDFYVNVAKDIGTGHTPCDITTHPSCHLITSNFPTPIPFDFKPITKENMQSFISKSGSKKATGVDGIPAKIFKSCSCTVSEPLSKLINFSLVTSTFPNRLKQAQVIPVYKKKDPLDKHNYRPISILPFVSKLYERSINLQLSAHFENFLSLRPLHNMVELATVLVPEPGQRILVRAVIDR